MPNDTQVADNPTEQKPATPVLTVQEHFPPVGQAQRLRDYDFYEKLFEGKHFEAFNFKIKDPQYTEDYYKLRYVVANFAGLVTRIVADMLFMEPIKVKVKDKNIQEFLDALIEDNQLNIQLYESQLSASSKGDTLFKLRGGPRYIGNENSKSVVIIEEVTPTIYFPEVNPWNVKQNPQTQTLAWKFKVGEKTYVRKEIHSFGKIENKVYELDGDKIIGNDLGVAMLGDSSIKAEEELLIEGFTLFHIPNPKPGNRFFGESDYKDLISIFYAINNRLTKVDNVLDRHTDPILAVPEGILDENGKVKRSSLNMVEIPAESEGGKPEYIVWNANLEAAFTELDKLIEVFFMTSETSPDALGMGKGMSDSGRALKLKLLRTIAKVTRKKLYYDPQIKAILYTAQVMAKAYKLCAGDVEFKGEPEHVEIIWQDGLPVDEAEQVDTETKRLDAGISSKKDSIMRIDDLDEKAAEEKVAEIDKETSISMPVANMGKFPGMDPTKLPPVDPKTGKPPVPAKPTPPPKK